uniref:Hypocretin neuropeptide precursor n=1 Tax=Naja naja TaxID=35670 RepID=A0A8C7DTA9_NAJNA
MNPPTLTYSRATSVLLILLLCSFAGAKRAVPDCCRQKSCSCRIFDLLHGMGNHAAGILTIGKRSSAMTTKGFQSRLYRLLHGSENQAAGILTMGKRATGLPWHLDKNPGARCCPKIAVQLAHSVNSSFIYLSPHSLPNKASCV